jgi:hypothetical protein
MTRHLAVYWAPDGVRVKLRHRDGTLESVRADARGRLA